MPSTVAEIFTAAAVRPGGVVRWGTPLTPPSPADAWATGIYVVALTDRLDTRTGAVARAPVSGVAVDELLAARPELRLDGARPTREQLIWRLSAFWFADEVVVYIGLAGPRKRRPPPGELAKRVGEYYKTPLGARGPHAGGWPLKTLAGLGDMFVHFAYCDRVDTAEALAIASFARNVSEQSRTVLRDPVRVMPFANLEFPRGTAKDHGIRDALAPKATSGAP